MAKRMHSFSGDWRLIDTAPMDQDVTLLVTDGRGEPYCIPYPCKLTASGWVNSGKGTPLAVTPLQWKHTLPQRNGVGLNRAHPSRTGRRRADATRG
jgi:hypothetical protein